MRKTKAMIIMTRTGRTSWRFLAENGSEELFWSVESEEEESSAAIVRGSIGVSEEFSLFSVDSVVEDSEKISEVPVELG